MWNFKDFENSELVQIWNSTDCQILDEWDMSPDEEFWANLRWELEQRRFVIEEIPETKPKNVYNPSKRFNEPRRGNEV